MSRCPDRLEAEAFPSIMVALGICSGQLHSATKTQSIVYLETRKQEKKKKNIPLGKGLKHPGSS